MNSAKALRASNFREQFLTSGGIVLVLLGASIEPILVKFGYRGLASPFQLFYLKTMFGFFFILPLLAKFKWIGWKRLAQVASVGLQLLFTSGMTIIALRYLPAVLVITILTTTPAFVALVNQWLGRDVLGIKFWLGFALAFFGVTLTVEFQSVVNGAWFSQLQGFVCLAAVVISVVIYRTRLEAVTRLVPSVLVSTYVFLINGIVALVVFTPYVGQVPSMAWPLGIWMGAAAVIANIAFLYAISKLGSTRVSVLTMLERPTIIILAGLLLHEKLSAWQIFGIAMVLIGTQLARVKHASQSISTQAHQTADETKAHLTESVKR